MTSAERQDLIRQLTNHAPAPFTAAELEELAATLRELEQHPPAPHPLISLPMSPTYGEDVLRDILMQATRGRKLPTDPALAKLAKQMWKEFDETVAAGQMPVIPAEWP